VTPPVPIPSSIPPTNPPAPTTGAGTGTGTASVADISSIVDKSTCIQHSFTERGHAPKSFLRGLAVSYAKAVCKPTRPDVVFVGDTHTGNNDALSWYGSILQSKLGPTTTGLKTVRQLYTLLVGLGMRESSGVHCTGRDMSAAFSSADSAEAGLFQTSYGAHTRSSLMTDLFKQYQSSRAGCATAQYTADIKCSASNLKNWGTTAGTVWQKLTKECPSFATEYAAVLLRLNGGARGEWGPLRKKNAEVVRECYDMFGAVESYVTAHPAICPLVLA